MSNPTPLRQFEYKAYDSDRKIVFGHESAVNFQHLCLTLRQKGLQVLEATAIDPGRSLAEDRLLKMKKRIDPPEPDEDNDKPCSPIRRWLVALIHLFSRG